ncbi:zinc transporter 10 precursor [Euphorbia peplus]|nr:zinc transporter 10 precursor [Euphorbia peplus]
MGVFSKNSITLIFFMLLIIVAIFTPQAMSQSDECEAETSDSCNNKKKALPLKIIAIVSILVTSMIGVCAPLFSKSIPAFDPNGNVFVIVKCFASGIILGTGFMHVLPDSFDMLWSDCLKENPWHKFPFTGFVAMLSALVTLLIDSMATSVYTRKGRSVAVVNAESPVHDDREMGVVNMGGHGHGHGHFHGNIQHDNKASVDGQQLLRYRVVAMVLELGIIVHSVVIGLSLGASSNTCSIKGLIAALCFHQMFEGMGLGGCILQAEYNLLKKIIMAFFFSVTTPFGIALGLALSNTYKENSPTALITVGLLNAASAGLLVYMALVDLLAADFMGPKLQKSNKLQIKCFVAVLLGAGGMSLMAKWA